MEFKDLEYIALEGGGGKGAVYKGAIVALEKMFDKAWQDGLLLKMKDGELVKPDPKDIAGAAAGKTKNDPVSILEYARKEDESPKIKGISGSSAGSITAFPLSLGLTSTNIETILKTYPFSEEFLPNNKLHEGKYRMVGMDGEGKAKILVAEDHLKKLGENKIEQYQFSAGANINVGSSFVKSKVRNFILSEAVKIILIGLKDRFEVVSGFIKKIQTYLNNPDFAINFPKNYLADFLKSLQLLNDTQVEYLAKFLFSLGHDTGVSQLKKIPFRPNKWKTFDLIPTNHMIPAVGNILWDRGIYAGFEVRDFFYKILLMAISQDTHFRRELVRYLGKNKAPEGVVTEEEKALRGLVTKEEIEGLKITFDGKFQVESDDAAKKVLNKLRKLPEILTFKLLHEITQVNLTVCVTNATTNQPVYFSHYFTPDFPVLEAVGASMNFPIAFKPTYNEANVLLNAANALPSFVDFVASRDNAQVYKETFNLSEVGGYDYYLGKVLQYVKDAKGLQISTNGNLSFRSFLPYLTRLLQDNKFDDKHAISVFGSQDVARKMCHFFYNAAFKGLLIDGGVTNNLPSSVFTFTTDKKGKEVQDLTVKKKVLSLKLDNSFPTDLRNEARNILKNDKEGRGLLKEINEGAGVVKDKIAQYAFASLLFKKMKLKKAYARNAESLELLNLSREVWIKIGKELIEEYRREVRGFTPWNKQVNVVVGLLNSLQFGMDQGQIESIEDNENIIPLHCYGVGTLDFDLKSDDLKPLVALAVEKSEKQVAKYFADAKAAADAKEAAKAEGH